MPLASSHSLQTALCQRFLLVFLDGFGLGKAGEHNPLAQVEAMPFLTTFLGQLLLENVAVGRDAVVRDGVLLKFCPKTTTSIGDDSKSLLVVQ